MSQVSLQASQLGLGPDAVTEESQRWFDRAKKVLAGGISSSARSTTTGDLPYPLYITHGRGARIWDADGNEFIDYLCAYGSCILGHTDPELTETLARQIDLGTMFGTCNTVEVQLAEQICRMVPCADLVRYANSGSEAIQGAIRAARGFTGRTKILKFEGHYHGWVDTLAVSNRPSPSEYGPLQSPNSLPHSLGMPASAVNDVVICPWNNPQILRSILDQHQGQLAAMIAEPIVANNACIMPDAGYLELLREECTQRGIVLIYDEIVTGFRLAPGGAQEAFGVIPDIAVFSKAVGGGLPLSVFAGRKAIMDLVGANTVKHGGTYNGSPLAATAALHTLQRVAQPGVLEQIRNSGLAIMEAIRKNAKDNGISCVVQGAGSMFQVIFNDDGVAPRQYRDLEKADTKRYAAFRQALLENGIHSNSSGLACWFVSAAHTTTDTRIAAGRREKGDEGHSVIFNIADKLFNRASPDMMAWGYRNTPAGLARAFASHRFQQTVRYAAKHSAFYRDAFAQRGIIASKIRTPADLGDFFTTPDDLVRDPESFICRPPNIVFESSGTSGKNKQVFYDKQELESIGKVFASGFRLMGLTRHDRVANAFDFNIWIPGLVCHYGLMAAGNFCQAFGKVDPVEVYRRLKQNQFTVVMGEPTWLIRLTQLAEQDGGGNLRFLIGGAEEMPADAIPWMKKVWNGATVKMNYASVEMASAIAFQPCDNHDGYHLDTVDFLPEIVDQDSEGYGELVYTTLSRRTMPLIRYRSRDVARIDPLPCPCGLPAPRLSKLRGRRDELVVASGGNLYPKMFEEILRPIRGLTHDWQVVFRLEGVREILEINVESTRTDFEDLEADIHRSATDLYPDLMKNLAIGIFEMRLVVHPPQTIRTARKLKRMVDRRHHTPPPEIAQPAEYATA